MSIVIKTKNILVNGEPKIKVTKVKAKKKDKLPEEYLNGKPRVCYYEYPYSENCLRVVFANNRNCVKEDQLTENRVYTLEEFNRLLDIIKAAGQRLHDINQRNREKYKDWCGKVTYVI